MKIIEPSVSLHTPVGALTPQLGKSLLQWIEFNARLSHRSEDLMTDESWKRFLPAVVIEHGDWSVVEHAGVTAIFRVDRGVTHELVRHRLFSFTQESTRFVNYAKKQILAFVQPAELPEKLHGIFTATMEGVERQYLTLLENGARPQEARSVLPNATAATISVTGNLRNWRHFLLMRTSKETHADFRRVTIPLLEQFKKYIPILYDDIEPNQRQIDNLKKAR